MYLGSPLGIRTPAKRRRSWSERGCAENGPGGTRRGGAAAATRRGAGAGARRAPARRVHRRPLCGAARGVFVPGGYLCFFFFCGRGAPPGRRGPREAAACTTDGPLGRFACAERVGGRPPMVARRARLWMGRVLPRRPRRAPPLAIPAREQLGSPPLCPRLWRQHDVSGGGCLDRRGLWQRVPAWSPQSAPRCRPWCRRGRRGRSPCLTADAVGGVAWRGAGGGGRERQRTAGRGPHIPPPPWPP